MIILVAGANGQLGSELRKFFEKRPLAGGNVLFVDREQLDITDSAAVQKFFAESKIDYCINAAAYTNVEKAEDEREVAHAVNVTGAENIARACVKSNTIFFHISTDFVFDGKKSTPYSEENEPHPLGAYGMTKYEGELVVQEQCPKSFIIRTSWLYSSYGGNFVKTILRLCKERESLPVVADQYGSPTYARDLAEALFLMIESCEEKKTILDDLFGIYHYANDGEVTWFEFAQKICELAGLHCTLQPIPASEYPSKVIRPAYSVLSTKKIQKIFSIAIPDWDESLKECVEKISP